jgi:hypothetical protein
MKLPRNPLGQGAVLGRLADEPTQNIDVVHEILTSLLSLLLGPSVAGDQANYLANDGL